jgi:hypothetical protein
LTQRELYHRKANACVQAAEKMRDPQQRVAMLEIAQDYMKLAYHVAARHERGPRPPTRYPDCTDPKKFPA